VNKKYKASQVHVTVVFCIFFYSLFSDAVVSCDCSVE